MKSILIFGGTGFIGRNLIEDLKNDYRVIVLSRNPEKYQHFISDKVKLEKIDYSKPDNLIRFFDEADAIINLAGENVGSRWTTSKKNAIKNSRLDTDKLIVTAFKGGSKKPTTIIQGSGMGVYGFETSDDTYTEDSSLGLKGFLTEVGIAHEKALEPLKEKTRLVFIRTGLVLDGKGRALPQMAMPFRFLLEDDKASGAYNLTTPNPVRNKDFAKTLGKALNRPSYLSTPAPFLKMMMGDMANELLLCGLKIIPKRLLDAGFRFQFEHIDDALKDIYK